jgi:SAM-dependent methyltransferase
MRTNRIDISTVDLDNLEMDWWNKNALLIEKIWALNYKMQILIRLPYLRKMKKFFLKGSINKQVKILEIGCGSGWVCRLVADENFRVVGTDFSEEQIQIAKKEAVLANKNVYCSYELADASTFEQDFDGVVIHALLHHLSKEELSNFFSQLGKIKSGTKVYMYEPVFMKPIIGEPTIKDKILNKLITKLKSISITRAKKNGESDTHLQSDLENLYKEARAKGWYLSPKEVPFYEDELFNYLQPLFNIEKKYIVNRTDLEIAQSLMLNKIESPNFLYSKLLIPLSSWLDSLAFKGKYTNYIQPLQHQFVCLELVKK